MPHEDYATMIKPQINIIIMIFCFVCQCKILYSNPNKFAISNTQGKNLKARKNAEWLLSKLDFIYREAARFGNDIDSATIFKGLMNANRGKNVGKFETDLSNSKNPWAGYGGAPMQAFNLGVIDFNPEETGFHTICNEANLGVTFGFFCPRDPMSGRPAFIATAVYTKIQNCDFSVNSNPIYSILTKVDESAKDKMAVAVASRLHQLVCIRYKRALASSLPLASASEFQASVFGTGAFSTEIPIYWKLQNQMKGSWLSCDPVVKNEISDHSETLETKTNHRVLWQINLRYSPGDASAPPYIITSVLLLNPLKGRKHNGNRVFVLKKILNQKMK